jgi:hypothetical protein
VIPATAVAKICLRMVPDSGRWSRSSRTQGI